MSLAKPQNVQENQRKEKIRKGLADAFTIQKIEHKDVVKLSETQFINLKRFAKFIDVKLLIMCAGVILVQREHSGVTEIVSKTQQSMNEIFKVSRADQGVKLLGKSLKTLQKNHWVAIGILSVHEKFQFLPSRYYFFLSISISSRSSELFSSSLTGYQSYLHTSVYACSLATALLTNWEPTHRNQVEITSQNTANLYQSSFEFRDVSEIFH